MAAQSDRRRLDAAEKWVTVLLFGLLAYRMLSSYLEDGSAFNLIYLADQLLVLVFVAIRRSTDAISVRPRDWLAGAAGTFLPLLMGPAGPHPLAPGPVVLGFMLTGLSFHLWAKLSLRRSFGLVAANRGVKVEGPYRIVRHPMYAGYVLTHIGFLLAGPTLNNVVVVAAAWIVMVFRIEAEEAMLKDDPAYAALMGRTRYRLIPGLY
ncbi:methyltransferase family protein [Alsobacter sp. R-9]